MARRTSDDFRYQYYVARAIEVVAVDRGRWTRQEIAARAAIDPQSFSRKMNLERHFMLHEIVQIAEALGMTPHELLGIAETRRAEDPYQDEHDRLEENDTLSRKMRNDQHQMLERMTTGSGDHIPRERRLG